MPTYLIRVVNANFTACDEHDLPSLAAAVKEGVSAALAMGIDEVVGGKSFFGAEIRIEQQGETSQRMMVAVGATPIR